MRLQITVCLVVDDLASTSISARGDLVALASSEDWENKDLWDSSLQRNFATRAASDRGRGRQGRLKSQARKTAQAVLWGYGGVAGVCGVLSM